MNKIRSNARQIIEEQYKSSSSDCTLREYVLTESENDPNFFRWLFNEELDEDFDMSLSNEQRVSYNEFLETLKNT